MEGPQLADAPARDGAQTQPLALQERLQRPARRTCSQHCAPSPLSSRWQACIRAAWLRAAIRQASSSRRARSSAACSRRRACAVAACRAACSWNALSLAATTAASISCARSASATGCCGSGAAADADTPPLLLVLTLRRWRRAVEAAPASLRPGVTADTWLTSSSSSAASTGAAGAPGAAVGVDLCAR